MPTYLRRDRFRRRFIQKRVEEYGVPLFTGALDFDRKDGFLEHYNSIFMFNVDGSLESYYKIHLVPLAEYNPLNSTPSGFLNREFKFWSLQSGDSIYRFFPGRKPVCGRYLLRVIISSTCKSLGITRGSLFGSSSK